MSVSVRAVAPVLTSITLSINNAQRSDLKFNTGLYHQIAGFTFTDAQVAAA